MDSKFAAAIGAGIVILFLAVAFLQSNPKYFDDKSPVLYFYSDTCSHCIEQKPVLYQLADEGFRVKPVKYPDATDLFSQYSVSGTPTFVAAQSGTRLEGTQNATTLREFLLANGAKIA